MANYAKHRVGVVAPTNGLPVGDSKGGVEPAGDTARCGVEPTAVIRAKADQLPHARIEGRCDTDVKEYTAVATTAWVVDTGASYDSVPGGLAERRGWKRAPLSQPVTISTANGHTTSDFAIITKIPGMPDEVRAVELGRTPPLLSVGRRCRDDGYTFVWLSGKNPYFVTSDGTIIPCLVSL